MSGEGVGRNLELAPRSGVLVSHVRFGGAQLAVSGRTFLRYAVCDGMVELELDDPALRDPLSYLCPGYEVSLAKAAAARLPAVRVRTRAEAYMVEPHRGAAVRCADLAELVAVCEFALAEALLAVCSHLVHLHAGGAVVDGRAILAVGPSGVGKSSLASAWAGAGYAVLGDDVVLLNGSGYAVPFKRLFTVQMNVLQQAGLEPYEAPFWALESGDALYDPRDGPGWGSKAPVALLAFPEYRPGSGARLEPVSRATALGLLLGSAMVSGLSRRESFELLCDLAEHAELCRVTFGSATEAARVLAAEL